MTSITPKYLYYLIYMFLFIQRLQKMVEHWMEKYDTDVDSKQKELDILKASKAKDLEKLQNLTKTVSFFRFSS